MILRSVLRLIYYSWHHPVWARIIILPLSISRLRKARQAQKHPTNPAERVILRSVLRLIYYSWHHPVWARIIILPLSISRLRKAGRT